MIWNSERPKQNSQVLLGGGKNPKASMARNKEPSTPAAGGTPWKGRLRSHHATPQSLFSRRLPSPSNNRNEVEEPQTGKKPAAPKNTRRCGGSRAEETGAARVPRAPARRSPRLAGRDPEHPIVIDDGIEVGVRS